MRYGSKRSYNKRYYKSNSKRNYKKNPTTRTLNKKIKKMQKQQELKYNDNWERYKHVMRQVVLFHYLYLGY